MTDPEPYTNGKARYPYPGWLNGKRLEYQPRENYDHEAHMVGVHARLSEALGFDTREEGSE